MSSRGEENSWNQTTIPRHDHKKSEEIFHLRSPGKDCKLVLNMFPIIPCFKTLKWSITWCVQCRAGCDSCNLVLLTLRS